jgi:two-component system CheB/CheR fusion protein
MAKEVREQETIRSANIFWVVGIGASAGGLDAFKQLVKAIPVDSSMAYILVQHLDPNHESILVELLQKITLIPIVEITDNLQIQPDHIYVIPPNKFLTATDGILKLTDRGLKGKPSMAIDLFFQSLAEVHQSQAIGVVLSGTGRDGTLGLKAIKDHGGVTFAQLQQSAAFGEMPQSAINADVVDFVLRPEEIIHQLLNLNNASKPIIVHEKTAEPRPEDIFFKKILALIDAQKAVDFTYYKQTTIRRRIARRIVLKNLAKIEDYYNYLIANSSEIDILYEDILIPVTDFFRDPDIFEAFAQTGLPALTLNKTTQESIRVWVVGCSTGQEAYSIAISLLEFFENKNDKNKIQIFATDISERAITKARTGFYSRNEVENVSEERLQKFFTLVNGGFQINKSVRDLCVFANHNVLTNPPFANISLVSCRNVLIYMDTFLQRKAMATFHYSLNEKGMLLLGKSESVGNSSDLFGTFSELDKLYTRRSVPGRFIHVAARRKVEIMAVGNAKPVKDKRPNDDFQRNAEEIILARAPNGVIVNDQMEIIQFRGATGDWLEAAPGKPSLNVLKMAKYGLSLELRNILHKVKTTREPFLKEGISLRLKGWKKLVTIEVIPLLNTINLYYLILFKNTEEILELKAETKPGTREIKSHPQEVRALQLEKELSQTREDMRTITEDQEAGNEELLSANEELLSGSEELRSLNEELEISKEEMQSTVEELSVANQELAFRNDELNRSHKYAEAIVTTIREPLIVLDRDLKVKSANASFYKTFQRTEKETEGKLFYELDNNQWDIPELRKILARTLDENTFYESYEVKRTFTSIGKRTMLLNSRKIVSEVNNEHLILLAIEDVTEQKRLEDQLKKSADYVKGILESSPQMTSTASSDGQATYFNQYFLDYSGLTLVEALASGWQGLVPPAAVEEVSQAWEHSIATGEKFYKELQFRRHDGMYRWHISRAIPIRNSEGLITSWVGTASDIHQQKMFSEELEKQVIERTLTLKETNINLEHSNKNLEQFAFIASHDLQEPLRKIRTFAGMLADNFSEHLPDQAKKLLKGIFGSSERMTALIEDVLNFSRIENSKNVYIPTDLNTIVEDVLNDFASLITEKSAVIKIDSLPTTDVIPLQMVQLFYNLFSNSLKFTRQDVPPVISVTFKTLTPDEVAKDAELDQQFSYGEILFSDNGIGFEQKYKEKIFLIFQRLHTKDKFAGTGIGLALCRKVMTNHGGKIVAEGRENEGASFRIILPLNIKRPVVEYLPGYVM